MSKSLSIKKLEAIAVEALEDIKGRDIIMVNTAKVSQMFERIILASGDSNRQVRSLARSVADKVREAGGEVLSIEGEDSGEWVLVDLGPVVVHIMQPTIRAHFDLEGLWGEGKPVGHAAEMAAKKAANKAARKAAVTTSEQPTETKTKAPAAKKPAAKKSATAKTVAKKPAARKPAAKKPGAKKAVTRVKRSAA